MKFKVILFVFCAYAIDAFALSGVDPYFAKQTALHYARLDQALPLLLDDKTTVAQPVLVGMIDEGDINSRHPDMTGVLLPESDSALRGSDSHAQYVVGVLSAQTNNAVGISGAIGMHANVIYRKIRNIDEVVANINRLAARGVAVISMSLGINKPCAKIPTGFDDGDKCQVPIATNPRVAAAIANAMRQYNTVFVISAANEGEYLRALAPQADGLIVVGGMSQDNRAANYSNYGPGVSLFAPDFGVWGLSFNGYKLLPPATSFTTPLVAGAAAWATLYLQAHGVKYTPKDIKTLILKSTRAQAKLVGKAEVAGSLDYLNLANALQTFVANPKVLVSPKKPKVLIKPRK